MFGVKSSLTARGVCLVGVCCCLVGVCSGRPKLLSHDQTEEVVGGVVTCLLTACIVSKGWGQGMMSYNYHKYDLASAEITPYDTANSKKTATDGTTYKDYNCDEGTPHCSIATLHTPATEVTECSDRQEVTKYKCEEE